jgi:hypothetical protein
VRMRLGLRAESGRERLSIPGNFIGQKLEGDEAMQSRVLGFVYHTHAATTELLDDAIVRNGLADHWCRILCWRNRQVNETR